MSQSRYPIIESNMLVESLRDSGYKSPASAISELGDNAFQAGASEIKISIESNGVPSSGKRGVNTPLDIKRVVVSDNGSGMSPDLLRNSVRFGFSNRYNDRTGMGRYG